MSSDAALFTVGPVERRKRRIERGAYVVLLLTTSVLVLPLAGIFSYLVVRASPLLSWSFLLKNPTHYMSGGGVWSPLVGTFYLVGLSLAIAAPVGVLAGVYLNEYARDNWRTRLVNLAVLNLAGVPSIVHALFGVGAFVLMARLGRSTLAASCTLAVMTLPVIIASTKEALAAVPMAFREACWNLGASRWQTIRTVVLPNAVSGILTGVILQVSRAAGETAPNVLFGLRVHDGARSLTRVELDDIVERALTDVLLWNDVKDSLRQTAPALTLEQQQKLCIARLLPLKPRIILMDEPCSALDAAGTAAIEQLIATLRENYTIVVVTHNMAQARRASDECIFMLLGEVVERQPTLELFLRPQRHETEMYVEGRYG